MAKTPKLRLEEISLAKIQGRKARAEQGDLRLLAESIQVLGVYSPPWVVREGRGYRLIAGASRLAVARREGLERISCLVLPFEPETPQAKLAFIDENLMRVELSPADRDEMWKARATFLAQINPAKTVSGRKAEGGQTGGETAGRGRPADRDARKPGIPIRPPSKEPEARAQQDGVRRKENAEPGVWDLYRKGELKQSQMDVIVTLPPEAQKAVAPEVIGKGVGETKLAVRIARAAADDTPDRKMAELLTAFAELEKYCVGVQVRANTFVALADALDVTGMGGLESRLALAQVFLAAQGLRQVVAVVKGKGEGSNGQKQFGDDADVQSA